MINGEGNYNQSDDSVLTKGNGEFMTALLQILLDIASAKLHDAFMGSLFQHHLERR